MPSEDTSRECSYRPRLSGFRAYWLLGGGSKQPMGLIRSASLFRYNGTEVTGKSGQRVNGNIAANRNQNDKSYGAQPPSAAEEESLRTDKISSSSSTAWLSQNQNPIQPQRAQRKALKILPKKQDLLFMF